MAYHDSEIRTANSRFKDGISGKGDNALSKSKSKWPWIMYYLAVGWALSTSAANISSDILARWKQGPKRDWTNAKCVALYNAFLELGDISDDDPKWEAFKRAYDWAPKKSSRRSASVAGESEESASGISGKCYALKFLWTL